MIVYSFSSIKQIYIKWDLTISYEQIDDIRRYKIYNYKYICKLNDVQSVIDNHIKNRLRSFSIREIEYTNPLVFRFGKYKDQRIDNINDIDYTCWYFSQIKDEEHLKAIKDFLYENWCEFKLDDKGKEIAISPDKLARINSKNNKKQELISKIQKGQSQIYLIPTRNPNEKGELIIDGITYVFPKVALHIYNSYAYFLPVLNGHVKRIKNKKLLVNLLYFDDKFYIGNFQIIK